MVKKPIRIIKKFFKWLWYGKSVSSYLAFIIFSYLVLKFVAFPAFLFTFGLNDVVAVLSNSMHHQEGMINITYDEWLRYNGFSELSYSEWPFSKGLNVGDAITVHPGEVSVGDVVVYYHGRDMIVHRVVNKTEINGNTYLTTKGDANPDSLVFERNIPLDRVVGKVGFRIPLIGWPRTLMYYLTGF